MNLQIVLDSFECEELEIRILKHKCGLFDGQAANLTDEELSRMSALIISTQIVTNRREIDGDLLNRCLSFVRYGAGRNIRLEGSRALLKTFCDEDIEVDSETDFFGIIYRVWLGIKLLGTFWRSPEDGLWRAEPFCCSDRQSYENAEQARKAVVNAWLVEGGNV